MVGDCGLIDSAILDSTFSKVRMREASAFCGETLDPLCSFFFFDYPGVPQPMWSVSCSSLFGNSFELVWIQGSRSTRATEGGARHELHQRL